MHDAGARAADEGPPGRPAAPSPRTPGLAPRASANHNTLLSLCGPGRRLYGRYEGVGFGIYFVWWLRPEIILFYNNVANR